MAVSVDATSSATGSVGTTLTWAHTVSAGDDRVLLVMTVNVGDGTSAVTFNGDAMTEIAGSFGVANSNTRTRAFYILAPDVATANIVATKTDAEPIAAVGISFFGAATPSDDNGQVADAATSSTLAITASAAGIIADIIGTFANTPTENGAQTEFGTQLNFSGTKDMSASYKAVSSGAQTMNWTFSSDDYVHSGVLIPQAEDPFSPKIMMF